MSFLAAGRRGDLRGIVERLWRVDESAGGYRPPRPSVPTGGPRSCFTSAIRCGSTSAIARDRSAAQPAGRADGRPHHRSFRPAGCRWSARGSWPARCIACCRSRSSDWPDRSSISSRSGDVGAVDGRSRRRAAVACRGPRRLRARARSARGRTRLPDAGRPRDGGGDRPPPSFGRNRAASIAWLHETGAEPSPVRAPLHRTRRFAAASLRPHRPVPARVPASRPRERGGGGRPLRLRRSGASRARDPPLRRPDADRPHAGGRPHRVLRQLERRSSMSQIDKPRGVAAPRIRAEGAPMRRCHALALAAAMVHTGDRAEGRDDQRPGVHERAAGGSKRTAAPSRSTGSRRPGGSLDGRRAGRSPAARPSSTSSCRSATCPRA